MQDSESLEAAFQATQNSLVSLAIESWRMTKLVARVLKNLDAGEQNRYVSQLRWFEKKAAAAMEQAEMRLVNVEGSLFDPGIAATPLNIDEFESNDALVVDQMVEPIIMCKGAVLRTGVVILRKVN